MAYLGYRVLESSKELAGVFYLNTFKPLPYKSMCNQYLVL